jgi:hypothetical protein
MSDILTACCRPESHTFPIEWYLRIFSVKPSLKVQPVQFSVRTYASRRSKLTSRPVLVYVTAC